MGKTYVALAVAYAIATQSRRGPVVIMVPPNLVDKWVQDLKTFCELYVDSGHAVCRDDASARNLRETGTVCYGTARHSVDFMKLLDNDASTRCHLIFLARGSMSRQQTDKWIRLALIREALRRYGRGRATRLVQVRRHIHRFMGELLWAIGEQRASDWGEELWHNLLQSDPSEWKRLYNDSLREGYSLLTKNPVPKAVIKALPRMEIRQLAENLERMPVRASGGSSRVSQRIAEARYALRDAEQDLWKRVLATARWRSPLLIMDEAHHLKNPDTSLARQLQSTESDEDLKTGDGALAQSFDRMLFLTATPFQLGHQELVRVLDRFGDIKWDDTSLGERPIFQDRLMDLEGSLTDSQRTAIALQRCWSRLQPDESPSDDPDKWWDSLQQAPIDKVPPRQRAFLDAFKQAEQCRAHAEDCLRPWLIRHNKGDFWAGTQVTRRKRIEGANTISGENGMRTGIEIPPAQLLPFFLAARSAVTPGKDLLGEALCSSYEAFRHTRKYRDVERDDQDDAAESVDLTHANWYLSEFDNSLERLSGNIHPKVAATVTRTVDLWEAGEKVLVFAFYRQTCRALRIHMSQAIEQRLTTLARRRFAGAGKPIKDAEIPRVLESIQNRYFDDKRAPGRQSLDRAISAILDRRREDMRTGNVSQDQEEQLVEVMRRFLRVTTTLVRCFPIHEHDTKEPHHAVRSMLDKEDGSGMSWRKKFEDFIDFFLDRCSAAERADYLDAVARLQTGEIRVDSEDSSADDEEAKDNRMTLANVREVTGKTRRDQRSRLMRAFNTPFFPDIFVCSQVMGEGVDLQRYCRYVIHHDLDWNPSKIEQRTGRIDRLSCKAEQKHPIHVYLPYISGAADERQFCVMTDREQWFRIVMGQDEVARLIPSDDDRERPKLPGTFSKDLTFHLGLAPSTD
jgi:hypothetical protein